jgi:hypothetical protein
MLQQCKFTSKKSDVNQIVFYSKSSILCLDSIRLDSISHLLLHISHCFACSSFSFRLSSDEKYLGKPSVQKVNKQVWIALGSTLIVAGSAYPVFRTDVRPGHELFSSEKPEAILLAQESKRKEYRKELEERRAELKKEQENLRQALQKE